MCAIYTNDEETCVAVARHLMRDGAITDSYRLFALLSRLCQSPVSWYTSGPAQKYILRQIKAIDASHGAGNQAQVAFGNGQNQMDSSGLGIDVCLLMLYGHILFTSTSYAFALGTRLVFISLDTHFLMQNWPWLTCGLSRILLACEIN